MDPYDAYWNQRYYAEWDEVICLNGNLCTHPNCPEHEVRDFWDRTDWPILMTDSEHMSHILEHEGATQWRGSATQ